MNDHQILGESLKQVGLDALGVVAGGMTAVVGGAAGLSELATGESIMGGVAAGTVLPVMWMGLGIGGVALAGYGAYKAATEYSHFKQVSNEDAAMFSAWTE